MNSRVYAGKGTIPIKKDAAPYVNLAAAVVLQACHDYKSYYRKKLLGIRAERFEKTADLFFDDTRPGVLVDKTGYEIKAILEEQVRKELDEQGIIY